MSLVTGPNIYGFVVTINPYIARVTIVGINLPSLKKHAYIRVFTYAGVVIFRASLETPSFAPSLSESDAKTSEIGYATARGEMADRRGDARVSEDPTSRGRVSNGSMKRSRNNRREGGAQRRLLTRAAR